MGGVRSCMVYVYIYYIYIYIYLDLPPGCFFRLKLFGLEFLPGYDFQPAVVIFACISFTEFWVHEHNRGYMDEISIF